MKDKKKRRKKKTLKSKQHEGQQKLSVRLKETKDTGQGKQVPDAGCHPGKGYLTGKLE